MTAEGVFPKVAGDIAYASEANRFVGAGKFFVVGSTGWVGSSTAFQDAGSYIIPAGSLTNPVMLTIDACNIIGYTSFYLQVSGLSNNGAIYLGSSTNPPGGGKHAYNVIAVLGSPLEGFVVGNGDDDTMSAKRGKDVSAIANFDTTQTAVVNFKLKTYGDAGAGSDALGCYFIKSEGRGY